MAGFCYQENTRFSQALPCTKEVFWELVRKPETAWNIDARRAILAAVDASKTQGVAAIQTWLNNSEYQKFDLKKQNAKKKEIREGWAEKTDAEKLLAYAQNLKENLPAFIFSCREFDATPSGNGNLFCHRRLTDCYVNGLVMLDIDHVKNPMEIWWKMRDMKELMERVALVFITSSNEGVRVIFKADIEAGNLADNQIVTALALNQVPDDSCIDATRNSFAPKEDDILYINEEILFDYYDEEFDKRYTPLYREKQTQPINHSFDSFNGSGDGDNAQTTAVAGKDAQQGSGHDSQVDDKESVSDGEKVDISWEGYDIRTILSVWSDMHFGDSGKGKSRHEASVKLARDLFIMFDRDKRKALAALKTQSWVQDIIKGRNEDVDRTVSNATEYVAAQEAKASKEGKPYLPEPSNAMQEVILKATGKSYQELMKAAIQINPATLNPRGDMNKRLDDWGAEIEALWGDFPLLKDVCAGLKRSQYPAALFVAGGCLMTLMTRCWYRFYHRPQNERRLNCSLYVIGHPASNKSMADDLCEILMAPMAAADKPAKAALNRYKKDTRKKAANKEGQDKPQGILRGHPSRTSNGQLIEDMINAKEIVDGREVQLHMFTFDTELDNSIMLQGGGSWINKMALELKAFHNEKDGQMYQNSDSPVDEFHVTWNYIYTGTPMALKRKVNRKNFGSGLSTRLTVIPVPKTNFEMIAFEEETDIDWERLQRMKEWAFKLDRRAGELRYWPLVKKLYFWLQAAMADCKEDNSEANELMLKRVPYHALNYAAPFIDMRHWDHIHQEGNYWEGEYEVDEKDWKLCELLARIQYSTQQHYFGVLAEKYFYEMDNEVEIAGQRQSQKSIEGFNQLPEVFTKEDVMRCFGYDNDSSARGKIKRLVDHEIVSKEEKVNDKGETITIYKKIKSVF